MTLLQAFFLGAIQGIAEFLPISSSAHLSIFSQIFKIPPQEFAFYIFLNLGSLLALIIFYKNDVWRLILGTLNFLMNKKTENRSFFLMILLSSIPAIVVFGIAETVFDIDIRSPIILASSMIIFAFVLYFCDRKPEKNSKISFRDSLLTGIGQVISLIPGVSRLGSCLTVMRHLEYSRLEAFRHSMILSIPLVLGACFLKSIKILTGKIVIVNCSLVIAGGASAFVFGLLSLATVSIFLRKNTLLLIVIYRIIFGAFIISKFCIN